MIPELFRQKSSAFLLLFCISLGLLFVQMQNGIAMVISGDMLFSWKVVWYIVLLLTLLVSSVVFFAILARRWWAGLFLLGIPFGIGLFQEQFSTLLVILFGLPFGLLFWGLRSKYSNRIRLQFGDDVRSSVVQMFLLFLFFFCILLVPVLQQHHETFSPYIATTLLPSHISENMAKNNISLDMSLADLIQRSVEPHLPKCNGDAKCETLLMDQAHEQLGEQMPFFDMETIDPDAPLIQELGKKIIGDMLPGQGGVFETTETGSFTSFLDSPAVSFGLGFLLFLLLSPVVIPLAFLVVLGVRILYQIFLITGILVLSHENVHKEILL